MGQVICGRLWVFIWMVYYIIRAERRKGVVAHFGLFRFRLCEVGWVGWGLLGLLWLSVWGALCAWI